ncbi:hypothetical protein Fot_35313 [Forsythia ovata]|uniref:Uncharacterized protein n=1 Tax=Forsythia ovata TaxID=205694 RepID=A0ABD1SLF4_9LAMI
MVDVGDVCRDGFAGGFLENNGVNIVDKILIAYSGEIAEVEEISENEEFNCVLEGIPSFRLAQSAGRASSSSHPSLQEVPLSQEVQDAVPLRTIYPSVLAAQVPEQTTPSSSPPLPHIPQKIREKRSQ